MEVGQKFGAEFRIIQEAEHQKLGTSKKSKKAVAIAVICRVLTSVCGT